MKERNFRYFEMHIIMAMKVSRATSAYLFRDYQSSIYRVFGGHAVTRSGVEDVEAL
jgi:hypothetical protein